MQSTAVMGNVIGRMAAPTSELGTFGWLCERSALGELLEVDFEAMSLMSLYRASDVLVKHREAIRVYWVRYSFTPSNPMAAADEPERIPVCGVPVAALEKYRARLASDGRTLRGRLKG